MKKRKLSLAGKIGISAAAAVFLLTVGTFAGLSFFFEDHYYYNTFINGKDYSYKTPVEAEEMMYETFAGYSLEITGREDVYDIILPAEIGMRCAFDDSLVRIKKEQNPWLWFLGFFREYSYGITLPVTYDQDALKRKTAGLSFFRKENVRAPSDAHLVFFPEKNRYEVVEGDPGTELDREKTGETVKNALERLDPSVNLEEEGCYKHAAVTAENPELLMAAETANVYLSTHITYDWNGNGVEVDAETVRDWIQVENNQVRLDGEKIASFVSEQAKKYDTYGKNRIFRTTDGREVELKSGAYGWKTDREAESAALTEAVKKGERARREPIYTYTAAQPGQTDIGDSYVEIDLGKQHLYLYVDGEVVLETDFVSGNAARGWNTPAGVFGLTYKTRNAVLRGENYETPVSFWMPFNGNIGMHDASWRGAFGGDIYLTNGSHGCINLPPDMAEIIYEYVYTGFPVVCYY